MKTEYIGFRIAPELKRALEKLAEKENRTLGNYCLTVLKNHVEEKKDERA